MARPNPTLFAVVCMVGACACLHAYSTAGTALDEQASTARIGHSPYLPVWGILSYRLVLCAIAWFSLVWRCCEPATVIFPQYFAASQLKPVPHVLVGSGVLATFTAQCWLLQALYFLGAAACSALVLLDLATEQSAAQNLLARAVLAAWQVSFPVAMMTSLVVTFFLIPQQLSAGNVPLGFFKWPQQCMYAPCSHAYRRARAHAMLVCGRAHVSRAAAASTGTASTCST